MRHAYARFDHFYVLNDRAELPDDMLRRTHFIRHSERDWLFLVNLWEAARILVREWPDVILSTGRGRWCLSPWLRAFCRALGSSSLKRPRESTNRR